MAKRTQDFTFTYPLKRKVVRNLKIVTEHIGDLVIECAGYFNPKASVLEIEDRYHVDIDAVKWNGTDIRDVLYVTGGIEEIEEEALRTAARIFNIEKEAA